MGTESSSNHTTQKIDWIWKVGKGGINREQLQHEDGNDGVRCVKQLYTWEQTEAIRIEKGHYRDMEWVSGGEGNLKILTPI